MSDFLILPPFPIAAVSASRGSGPSNLTTHDPKEAWVDTAAGSAVLYVDLGSVVTIDTIGLLYLDNASGSATWAIHGGAASPDVQLHFGPLRVPDAVGLLTSRSHALWYGAAVSVRFLTLTLTQPAGSPPLSAGALVMGQSFAPLKGQEWGAGRRPIDTGVGTALASGGFSVVEGVRKRLFNWTFGDLSESETDALEAIALELGETSPGLVVAGAARTAGLRARIHYGLFRWRQFERRNRRQTRWEVGIEEWI